MKSIKLSNFIWVLALVFAFTSCEKDDDDDTTPTTVQQKTIAEIATEDGNFTILLDALSRTNLTSVVADASADLTVFAPNDSAFGALLTELNLADLDAVETALGNDGLKQVLLYHVLGIEVKASAVSTGYVQTSATNTTNDNLSMYLSTATGVTINSRSKVIAADLDASNGVIHVIDKVLLPMTIFGLIDVNPNYSSLKTALTVADDDLDEAFDDVTEGPFTLFAPNNVAFDSLLVETMEPSLTSLVGTLGTDGLADVLLYHAVTGNFNSDEVPSGTVTTAGMETFSIDLTNGVVITDANARMSTVINFDIQGTNGVIHGINKVLLP